MATRGGKENQIEKEKRRKMERVEDGWREEERSRQWRTSGCYHQIMAVHTYSSDFHRRPLKQKIGRSIQISCWPLFKRGGVFSLVSKDLLPLVLMAPCMDFIETINQLEDSQLARRRPPLSKLLPCHRLLHLSLPGVRLPLRGEAGDGYLLSGAKLLQLLHSYIVDPSHLSAAQFNHCILFLDTARNLNKLRGRRETEGDRGRRETEGDRGRRETEGDEGDGRQRETEVGRTTDYGGSSNKLDKNSFKHLSTHFPEERLNSFCSVTQNAPGV
ncbi:unnamed protein product [Pleuronectes platessa]|uniref:Uncharacterized protein n=1 Tax=Pleuronectes platessa TaxID=8262 RepID=A0A9N7Y938_PLEPL|nr:unnamed protein product [Pleuronectes platessa]